MAPINHKEYVADLRSLYESCLAKAAFRITRPETGQSYDMATLEAAVARTAGRMQAAGVEPGNVVVYQGDAGAAAFVSFWAAMRRGAVFVPVDPTWPNYLLERAAARTAPALVVAEVEAAERWERLDPSLPVIQADDAVSRTDSIGAADTASWAPRPCGSAAAYLFTSGSTGEPKAVMLSETALIRSAAVALHAFHWQAGESLLNLPEPHTMSGLRNAFLSAPLGGLELLAPDRETRGSLFGLLALHEEHRPERLVSAPILLRQINLLGQRVRTETLTSLRAVYCTGADLGAAEARRFHERFAIPVVNYYGLTETVGICISQDPLNWQPDDATLGKPVGCRVRLRASGDDIEAADVGELQVHLPAPMTGYLDDPDATAARFDGEWLRTGDLARLTDDGRVELVGRADSFIKTTGTERIHPREIESVLERHPGVAEAAALGIRDKSGTERLAAVVVPRGRTTRSELSPERLSSFVGDHLGPRRVPQVFRVVQSIPRGAHGKIQRRQLRELLDDI